MASGLYTIAKADFLKGDLDWEAADIRALLVGTGFSFNPDHDFVSDISANEISGGGYARKTLAGMAVSQDDTNNRSAADATDLTWTALGSAAGTIAGIIIYKHNAADAAARLIYFGDFTDTPANGGDFTVQFHADGLWYW